MHTLNKYNYGDADLILRRIHCAHVGLEFGCSCNSLPTQSLSLFYFIYLAFIPYTTENFQRLSILGLAYFVL